jgi:hypothetical protein
MTSLWSCGSRIASAVTRSGDVRFSKPTHVQVLALYPLFHHHHHHHPILIERYHINLYEREIVPVHSRSV